MSGAAQIEHLESLLEEVGFTHIQIKPKDESKQFIRNWAPGTKIEDFVVRGKHKGLPLQGYLAK